MINFKGSHQKRELSRNICLFKGHITDLNLRKLFQNFVQIFQLFSVKIEESKDSSDIEIKRFKYNSNNICF